MIFRLAPPPLFFSEPPKNFPAAGKLDFCPTKIFSSNENISVVWLNVLHAMFYLVQKVFKVWSKFIFNFVKYVFRFKYRNRRTVVDAKSTPGRLTLGEETKARKLKQTALKFLQYRYFIDYSKMNKSL